MAPEFLDLFLLVHAPTAGRPVIGATKEIVFGYQDPAKSKVCVYEQYRPFHITHLCHNFSAKHPEVRNRSMNTMCITIIQCHCLIHIINELFWSHTHFPVSTFKTETPYSSTFLRHNCNLGHFCFSKIFASNNLMYFTEVPRTSKEFVVCFSFLKENSFLIIINSISL